MFRLILNHLADSVLFTREQMKYLTLNSVALKNSHYFEAGRIIALSLIHGGPGPHFFSKTLYHLVVYSSTPIKFTLGDLEADIANKLLMFQQENDLFKLRDIILFDTIFATAGCYFIEKLDDFGRIQEPLQQLDSGFETCGVLTEMIRYPHLYQPLFCKGEPPLSAEEIQELFRCIQYSPMGSNKRQQENRTICFFKDYLQDCEDGEGSATLQNILIFVTGADSIPPRGFEVTPKITFLYGEAVFPTASTCCIELRLPTFHEKYEEFKEKMDFAILNSNSFGSA